MAEQSGGFDFEDDFDPLFASDEDINQDDMDDDNPYDTVDYPTLRNMPEDFGHESVYTPAKQGDAETALLELIDHNPARRPVLLSIVKACEGGKATSELQTEVEHLQANNLSVYAPVTLCRMLERAGALTLEMPEVAQESEDVAEGVEYLQITEKIDPIWTATPEGLAVWERFAGGEQFRDIVMDRDARYLDVYKAIMHGVEPDGMSKAQIEELTDTFDVVKSPRRFGGHFIDMLERCDALEWRDHAWRLTDLGRRMLAELESGE